MAPSGAQGVTQCLRVWYVKTCPEHSIFIFLAQIFNTLSAIYQLSLNYPSVQYTLSKLSASVIQTELTIIRLVGFTITRVSGNVNVTDHGRHRAEVEDRRVGAESLAPAPTLRSNRVTPSQIRDIFTFGHDQLSDSKEIFYACKSCINQAYRETISVSSPVCEKKVCAKKIYV